MESNANGTMDIPIYNRTAEGYFPTTTRMVFDPTTGVRRRFPISSDLRHVLEDDTFRREYLQHAINQSQGAMRGMRPENLTEDDMKKLNHEQFKRRFMPDNRALLIDKMTSYVRALDYRDDAWIMSVELPLLLTETMPPPSSRPGTLPGCEALLLRGYRIIEVNRDKPNDPKIKAVYSKLTGKFHRTSWFDERVFNDSAATTGRLSDEGRPILLHYLGLKAIPNPLADQLTRLVMLLSQLQGNALCRAAWIIGGGECPRPDTLNVHDLRTLVYSVTGSSVRVCSTEPESVVLALKRVFGYDRAALARMWAIVDEYGMPEGPVGAALKEMDKFRTD